MTLLPQVRPSTYGEGSSGATRLLLDRFEHPTAAAGKVIGTRTMAGMPRRGRDVEGLMSIDGGALRLQPLLRPGWARQGIAYGPFERQPGLVMAVAINNGHNTSQGGPIPESFPGRVRQWLLGPHVDRPLDRGLAWLRMGRQRASLRRLHWWFKSTQKAYRQPRVEDNLAVGLFTEEAPADPLTDGCCFVVHAAEHENGELRVRAGGGCLPAFRRLKNVPLYYVIALRERGACYYVAGPAGAHGVGSFPSMRPVGIDATGIAPLVYAGVHQAALGQIGFRVDTRVHSVEVVASKELAAWFGSAHAADRLTGDHAGLGSGERGGAWRHIGGGAILRETGGAQAPTGGAAVLDPGQPSGLVHALIKVGTDDGRAGVIWRADVRGGGYALEAGTHGCRLVRRGQGGEVVIAEDRSMGLEADREHSLQVLDGHGEIGCYLDGAQLFGRWVDAPPDWEGTGTGIMLAGPGTHVRDFEAHAREVAPLAELVLPRPPWCRVGTRVVVADTFKGAAGDLAGRTAEIGGAVWQRTIGRGAVVSDGRGVARVKASLTTPNPGRTAYTVAWPEPQFADIEVAITPPGDARDQGHRGRGGIVLWQDDDNYVTCSCWLDDVYQGASISFFPKRRGFEELYDAVWTNVDKKILWGRRLVLRLACDGNDFLVRIDGEPVLQKALRDIYPDDPPLQIVRVGLVANWEWGNDTGSTFAEFRARS